MTETIQQLAERIRALKCKPEGGIIWPLYESGHYDACKAGAILIESWAAENQPLWVKITEDKSTWPTINTDIYFVENGYSCGESFKWCTEKKDMSLYFGDSYRLLGPHDWPPQEG